MEWKKIKLKKLSTTKGKRGLKIIIIFPYDEGKHKIFYLKFTHTLCKAYTGKEFFKKIAGRGFQFKVKVISIYVKKVLKKGVLDRNSIPRIIAFFLIYISTYFLFFYISRDHFQIE